MLAAVLAYLMWGLFPAYFPLLLPASPMEILAHRIVWTTVVMVVLLTITRRGWTELRQASAKTWLRLAAAGAVVSINWLIYVVAVNSDHVVDAALGYFMNPLVSVLLGMIFLREMLRPLQRLSVLIAAIGVAYLTILAGNPPIIGLALAFSFGTYGLIKKQVDVSASASLAAETLIIAPIAFAYLVYLAATGHSTFGTQGPAHTILLMSAGVVTALPLLFFGRGAKALPLATIGMLQYMTPTIQMLWALFVNHEHVEPSRWIGFSIIWVAVAAFMIDIGLHHTKRSRRARQARKPRKVADPPTV